MFNKLINNLKSNKDSANIVVNMAGTVLSMVFTIIFVPLFARLFGQVGYGVYAVLTAFIFTLVNVLDFGVTATIYANVPRLKQQNNGEVWHFLKSVVTFQLLLALACGLVLLAIYNVLDAKLFHINSSFALRLYVVISIPLFILQNTIQNTLFALKKFISSNVILNISNLARLLLVIALNATVGINLENSILVLCVLGPLLFILPAIFYYFVNIKNVASKGKFDFKHLQIKYTIANFVAQQCYNVGSRLDLFAISFYGLAAATGDYGIAQKIMLTVVSLVVAVTQVLSPNFSHIKTKLEFAKEVKHALLFVALPALCFLVFWVVPPFIFNIVIPAKFTNALYITRMLGIAYALFATAQIATLAILYTFKKPAILVFTNLTFLILMFALNFSLVPKFGSVGAVYSIFLSILIVNIALFVAIKHQYKTILT